MRGQYTARIYREMDIEIIEIVVNPDHVHICFKYPPGYSLSYIARKIKGVSSRILRKEFPTYRNGAEIISGRRAVSIEVLEMAGIGRNIDTQDIHHAKNASYRPRI